MSAKLKRTCVKVLFQIFHKRRASQFKDIPSARDIYGGRGEGLLKKYGNKKEACVTFQSLSGESFNNWPAQGLFNSSGKGTFVWIITIDYGADSDITG